jgi:F-type H+-transporting ATPase subunit b
MKSLFRLGLLTVAVCGVAAVAAEEAPEAFEFPLKEIIFQVLNFSVLVIGLVYLLKDKVRAHFTERARAYHELVNRAEKARQEAQARKTEIEQKIVALEGGLTTSKRAAQKDADDLKMRLLNDARSTAARLEHEAQLAARFEIERAKAQLRTEMVDEALIIATAVLKNQVGDPDRRRLQNEFVEKIQVVR